MIGRSFSICRSSKPEFSNSTGVPLPSFRKLTFSVGSIGSSSARINEDLAATFGGDLYDFQMSELRGATQNFSGHFLLGEGGFGRVHKGYLEEGLRLGLKAQAVAVKLLDIEGSSASLILGISHHEMICNHQHKYEDSKKVGKEAQVLIINHLANQR